MQRIFDKPVATVGNDLRVVPFGLNCLAQYVKFGFEILMLHILQRNFGTTFVGTTHRSFPTDYLKRVQDKILSIILSKDKNQAVVEMTLPEDNTQIFASKYQTVLPSKDELRKLLEN